LIAPLASAVLVPAITPATVLMRTSTVSPGVNPAPHVDTVSPGWPAAFATNADPESALAATHAASDDGELSGR
jgi:hypothetical protein